MKSVLGIVGSARRPGNCEIMGRVRCMLCSNTGTIRMENGTAVMQIDKAGHQLFLTRQDVLDHKAWLIGMKERFVSLRKTLKPITVGYRKEGSGIKPHQTTISHGPNGADAL